MTRILTIAKIVWLEMLRRKDLYVLLILMAVFLAAMLGLNIFGLGGLVAYVKEIGLLLLWIGTWVLTINFSARQLPREEATGTIFPLLAKPVTRGQFLLGKWLGAWGAGLAASALFHLLLVGVVLARGSALPWVTLAQHFLLHGCLLAILAAAGLMFSTRLHYDAAAALAYVFALGSFFVLPRVPQLVLHARGLQHDLLLALYFALPHLELFDLRIRLAYDWGALAWPAFCAILAYGALVAALLLVLAWLGYHRKNFPRSERL